MLAGPKYTRIRSFASDGSPPPDVDQENVCESCMRDCSFSESTESHVALEQDQEEEEGRGEGGEEEEGNRSNSAAVFRQRPSSLRRSISEPHLPQPVLLSQTAHGACAEDSDDESTTLCSFLPWLSALGGGRFSLRTLVKDLASFSRLATSDGATSSCASSPGGTQDGSRYTGSGRGFGDPVEDWNRSGSFINKPTRGWLHPDELVLGSGVLYNVRYMGCVEVMKSMRALDFTTRTQVTREAICQICETCASLKGIPRKRKPTQQPLCSILGNRNMQFSGFNITLTISISSLNLMMPVNKQIIANHHMQSISFASGGDQEMTDFVAYVAKDPVNHRACHILECEEGKAQDVICTIGQAFELRFKQYLGGPPRVTPFSDRGTGRSWFEDDEKVDHEYYNSLPSKEAPPGGLVDLRLLEGPPHCGLGSTNEARRGSGGSQGCQPKEAFQDFGRRPSGPAGCAWDGSVIIRQSSLDDPMYVNTGPGVDPGCPSAQLRSGSPLRPSNESAASFSSALARDDPLLSERWFHGRVSRQQVETMLHCDGDFLVRESTSTAGQFVLTGMHGGRAKHLLLVDPKGVVRTKDREFSNVSHLITYHRTNQLPIISAGSELCLRQPVERLAFD